MQLVAPFGNTAKYIAMVILGRSGGFHQLPADDWTRVTALEFKK